MDSSFIEEILEKDIKSLGCDIWGIEVNGRPTHQTLRVYIDKESGISIEDCEIVSNHIGNVLNAENDIPDDYSLEVSSPGLDRKIFKTSQYSQFLEQKIKVKFVDENNKFITKRGKLLEVLEDMIILDCEKINLNIPFNSIKKANLEITEV